MKTKITAFLMALCLLMMCGCGETQTAKKGTTIAKGESKVQYVLALNPSVIKPDGTVDSIRNNVAKNISADLKAKGEPKLYDNSDWQWIYSDGSQWNQRLIRTVALWTDGAGTTKNGVPYAYTVTDDGKTSLAVYDASKMKLNGANDAEIPANGVLMSFTGDNEEALIYTAKEDCTVTFSDFGGGNIAVVGSVAGIDTSPYGVDGAKQSMLLKVYKNNRIYWQEILNVDSPDVAFPEFSGLELRTGDSMIISVQPIDSADGITTGNCDLPATEKTVTIKDENKETVQVGMTDPYADEKKNLSFIDDNGNFRFKVISPGTVSNTASSLISDFRAKLKNTFNTDIEYDSDLSITTENEDYEIYIYNTKFEASKKVINEIKATRSANEGDFIIRMVGNKLIIAANSDIGIQFALDFFLKNYCKDSDSTIRTDINYISSTYNKVSDIKLAGTSVSDYTVVVSKVASMMETSAAEYLVKEITRITGKKISIVRDNEAVKAHEILIGDTNRANYRNLANYSTLHHNSVDSKYKITVTSKNTSVLASHIYGTNAGAIKLAELMKNGVTFKTGYTYNGEYDGEYSLTDGYKLTWADEFNGDTLSKTWISKGMTEVSDNIYGGQTIASRANSYVKDGALHQVMNKVGNDIYVASLYSQGSKGLRYQWGYIELRFKFSTVQGTTHSFWTQSDVAGGFLESDIYETFGNPYNLKHNLHIWKDGHENLLGGIGNTLNLAPGTSNPEPYGTEYHTVGWEWDDDVSRFYVDGELTISYETVASKYDVFNKPAWLILSMDHTTPSYGAENMLPDDFVSTSATYDWMHIYQKDIDGTVLYEKSTS